jgi:replication factor A1
MVQGRYLVVVLNCDIMENNPGVRLGDPQDISKDGPGSVAGAENINPQAGLYGNRPNNNAVKPEEGSNPYGRSGGSNPYGGNRGAKPNTGFGNNPYGSRGGGSAPIVRTTPGGSQFTPIASLNMYQSRWTIRARVTTKSDVRTWSNARGEGSLFSIELLDSSGVDVKATFFKEAVDKFYTMIEEGKVYTFSGGRMKVANMQYNTCKSNFEITFDQNAEIHLDNDAGDIRRHNYDFVPNIAHLEQVEPNKTVDVLAIVKSVGEPTRLVSKKTGNELTKCDMTLVDDSGVEINMTLWGDKANGAPSEFANNPVVAFRRCRVSDFGGKSLSLSGSADIRPDDVAEQVHRLEQWWNNGGSSGVGTKSLSSSGGSGSGSVAPFNERLDIASIKEKHMGYNEKPDWLTFKGTISFIKKDKEGGAWYPACGNAGDPCKNMYKVTQTTDGQWFCEKCGQNFEKPVRRWIFSATVEDDTGSTWVSFFNPQAETLLGGETTADMAYEQFMEHNQDQDGYDSLFHKATHTEWVFKCKVKSEMVNDEQRVKTSVMALKPVDYVKESEEILAALEKLSH